MHSSVHITSTMRQYQLRYLEQFVYKVTFVASYPNRRHLHKVAAVIFAELLSVRKVSALITEVEHHPLTTLRPLSHNSTQQSRHECHFTLYINLFSSYILKSQLQACIVVNIPGSSLALTSNFLSVNSSVLSHNP